MDKEEIKQELSTISLYCSAEWCKCSAVKKLRELITKIENDHTPAQKD